MQDFRFALDIGTRGVTGLLYTMENDQCIVHFTESEEHQDRAMQDGQIHDIQAVSSVIARIKAKLSEVSRQELSQVAVAAAGRALKTIDAEASFPLGGNTCSQEDVFNLQLLAVQNAKMLLSGEDRVPDNSPFSLHCVGYSVHTFYLDGERIGNLVGQRGQEAKVSLIATFLPRVVIDSLDSALRGADLLMHGLTLEPIAALNALIPKTMRKLNIALVDIGAGTSDIAITADGTVQAYGMVPIAGDEITDALVDLFLLDFPAAELLKRKLLLEPKQTFEDILGISKTVTSKKVLQQVKPSIDALAQAIADEILHLNGKSPTAVMLIGGGAKTPFIESLLAAKLGLSSDRVRVRDRESITNAIGCNEQLTGPEAVTPIGIALAAASSEITPITVSVDGHATRLFAFHPLTVGDALLEAGVDLSILKTRPGAAIVVEIDGQVQSLTGTIGSQGKLMKNHQPTSLAEILEAGDELEVVPGKPGQGASGTLGDLIDTAKKRIIWINHEQIAVDPVLLINGRAATATSKLKDRDQIHIKWPTVSDVLITYKKINWDTSLHLKINGEWKEWHQPLYRVTSDREGLFKMDISAVIEDEMAIYMVEVPPLTIQDVLQKANIVYTEVTPFQLTVNGKLEVFRTQAPILLNGKATTLQTKVSDRDEISYDPLPGKVDSPITISDVIYRLGDNLRMQGLGKARLIMRRNGETADFTTVLEHNDSVEIYWEDRLPDPKLRQGEMTSGQTG